MEDKHLIYLTTVKEGIQKQLDLMVENMIEDDNIYYLLKERLFLINSVINHYVNFKKEEEIK